MGAHTDFPTRGDLATQPVICPGTRHHDTEKRLDTSKTRCDYFHTRLPVWDGALDTVRYQTQQTVAILTLGLFGINGCGSHGRVHVCA